MLESSRADSAQGTKAIRSSEYETNVDKSTVKTKQDEYYRKVVNTTNNNKCSKNTNKILMPLLPLVYC